jgi:succinate dehydrogenase / fumarate reductase cytochrome b subunit
MAMSIIHRITGIGLYFGTLLVAWWLIAAATSPSWFQTANWLLGSWFGIIVLIGFTWAMFQHMLGGIRHFVWDTGVGLEKRTSTLLANLTWIAALLLTIITWAAYFWMFGGAA